MPSGSRTKHDVDALRLDLRFRALWWIGFFVLFGVCFWKACDTYVQLNDDPPWLKAVTSLFALAAYLAGPSILYAVVERRHRRFVQDFAARLGRLEARLDPARTTSGLLEDGRDPPPGS